MNNKTSILLVFILLVASCPTLLAPAKAEEARSISIPDDYPTIASAIEDAKSGDTIFIKNGTYLGPVNQTLVLNKAISIVGESSEGTIINLQPAYTVRRIESTPQPLYDYFDSLIITADDVSLINLTIRSTGLIKANSDRLQIISSNINTIVTGSLFIGGSNCNITNNSFLPSLNVEGSSNLIKQNNFDELSLKSGNCNIIESNNLQFLKLVSSNSNWVVGNSINAKYRSFAVEIDGSNSNNLENNYINGLSISNSTDNLFAKNNITSTTISIIKTYHYDIEPETLNPDMPSSYAIAIKNSKNNIFYQNFIENILINGHAVNNNLFYANSFVGPALANGIVGTRNLKIDNNYWDNGSIGNYWYDYFNKYPNALEIGNIGIGDIPYVISNGDKFENYTLIDHFPLTRPFSENKNEELSPEPIPVISVIAVISVSVVLVVAGLTIYIKKRKLTSKTSTTAPSPRCA